MKEIDSSVLIAYLAQKSTSENVSICMNEIREIGHYLEERHPSLIIDMDKYSIESFRIKSGGHVTVHNQKISFVKTDEVVQVLLQKNKPTDMLNAWLEEISSRVD